MSSIEEIIIAMEDMLENSFKVPLSGGKSVVNADQMLEFVDDMRANLPDEIRRARQIMANRDEVIARAQRDAEDIVADAHAKAQKMISAQEIYRLAQQKANETIADAQKKSNEMISSAIKYCDDLLARSEGNLEAAGDALKANAVAIRETRNNLRRQ